MVVFTIANTEELQLQKLVLLVPSHFENDMNRFGYLLDLLKTDKELPQATTQSDVIKVVVRQMIALLQNGLGKDVQFGVLNQTSQSLVKLLPSSWVIQDFERFQPFPDFPLVKDDHVMAKETELQFL